MYIIIWEFIIEPQYRKKFLEYYGPEGEWVKLFRKSADFISTELIVKDLDQNTFLTIDRWKSEQSYVEFLSGNKLAYEKMDRVCRKFSVEEKLVGKYFIPS